MLNVCFQEEIMVYHKGELEYKPDPQETKPVTIVLHMFLGYWIGLHYLTIFY